MNASGLISGHLRPLEPSLRRARYRCRAATSVASFSMIVVSISNPLHIFSNGEPRSGNHRSRLLVSIAVFGRSSAADVEHGNWFPPLGLSLSSAVLFSGRRPQLARQFYCSVDRFVADGLISTAEDHVVPVPLQIQTTGDLTKVHKRALLIHSPDNGRHSP